MRTKNSIDLEKTKGQCFAQKKDGKCSCLKSKVASCGTSACPFYKPKGKTYWIRVEDEGGVNLVPPSEYRPIMYERIRGK